jgi:serine/threonine-protein kinase Chk1
VYRAYNHSGIGQIAACKIVSLYSSSPSQDVPAPDLKELQKEVQVHRVLKHKYILEFMDSMLVKPNTMGDNGKQYVPGLYMLLELAMGGDMFDKIG